MSASGRLAVVLGFVILGSAASGGAPTRERAAIMSALATPPASDPDPVPDLPPFPAVPVLTPLRGLRRVTIARAGLTYRLLDGREIEGWGADIYEPRGAASGTRPLIVMLPAGGIRTDLTTSWSRAFARRGFAALALHRLPDAADEGVLHSLKGTAKTLRQDAANLSRVIAWARSLPQVDPDRIGVLGVSRGAIATALVAEDSPSLSAVFVLGGADLAGLFRDSGLGVVKKMRRREIERNGGSLERAMARARTILGPVDPATRAGRLDPSRILLINARWDRVIPRAQALALRRAARGPRQAWLPSGHYGALLFSHRVRRLALDHFERVLGTGAQDNRTKKVDGRSDQDVRARMTRA